MRLLVVLGLVALYLPFVGAIARVAATDPYAGHVLFVPLVTAIILWSRRGRFRTTAGQGSSAGLALVGGALALLALAHGTGSYTVHALSIILAVVGVGLWLRGSQWIRQAAFPLGFLVLIIPPPRGLIASVTPTIQDFIANFSSTALSLFQIPVERKGALLHLPNATLHIDEGCNGLRFLLVLVVIITALAEVLLPTPARRFLLITGAIPAAVLANAIRVTEIAVAAYLFGPRLAGGMHDYIGRGTWLLTIAALLVWAIVLRRSATVPPMVRWAESPQPKKA